MALAFMLSGFGEITILVVSLSPPPTLGTGCEKALIRIAYKLEISSFHVQLQPDSFKTA